jgi:hypothetical protein
MSLQNGIAAGSFIRPTIRRGRCVTLSQANQFKLIASSPRPGDDGLHFPNPLQAIRGVCRPSGCPA